MCMSVITHAQWGAWVIKWAPFLRFGVTFVHANLCSHTFTTRCLGWEGGRGLFEIFSSSCKNYFVVLGKCVERFLKKQYSLKMYVSRKYQFILHDKNIVRVTSNQPSIPCFKPHKTWRSLVVTCCAGVVVNVSRSNCTNRPFRNSSGNWGELGRVSNFN